MHLKDDITNYKRNGRAIFIQCIDEFIQAECDADGYVILHCLQRSCIGMLCAFSYCIIYGCFSISRIGLPVIDNYYFSRRKNSVLNDIR